MSFSRLTVNHGILLVHNVLAMIGSQFGICNTCKEACTRCINNSLHYSSIYPCISDTAILLARGFSKDCVGRKFYSRKRLSFCDELCSTHDILLMGVGRIFPEAAKWIFSWWGANSGKMKFYQLQNYEKMFFY